VDEGQVLREIAELATAELEVEAPLFPETRLVEDLALDSLRRLTLAVAIEDRFRICFDPEDEAALTTVGDLVTLVRSKLAGEGGRG
jgi:acyl carrier protein